MGDRLSLHRPLSLCHSTCHGEAHPESVPGQDRSPHAEALCFITVFHLPLDSLCLEFRMGTLCCRTLSALRQQAAGVHPSWPVAFRAVPLMRITRLCVSPNVSRGSCVLPHGLGQDIHHDREKPTVVLFCVLRSTVLRYSHPGLSATASPLRYDPSPAWPGVCRPLCAVGRRHSLEPCGLGPLLFL